MGFELERKSAAPRRGSRLSSFDHVVAVGFAAAFFLALVVGWRTVVAVLVPSVEQAPGEEVRAVWDQEVLCREGGRGGRFAVL
eukprot:6261410-Alexandrium_andersonii.AAC.1